MASMTNRVRQYLNRLSDNRDSAALRHIIEPIADHVSSQMMSSPALLASSTTVQASQRCHAVVDGVIRAIATGTEMTTPVGTITSGEFNVWSFFIDKAGTITSLFGTENATLGSVKFPPFPEGKAHIGSVLVTATANFVGGTTSFDGAGVTSDYWSAGQGGFDPSVRLG